MQESWEGRKGSQNDRDKVSKKKTGGNGITDVKGPDHRAHGKL